MLSSLDSDALYDILANTPSPTAYDNHSDDGNNDHSFRLRHSAAGDVARAPSNASISTIGTVSTVGTVGTVGGEFLRVVCLDSPGVGSGTTQPLRVRKKVSPRVADLVSGSELTLSACRWPQKRELIVQLDGGGSLPYHSLVHHARPSRPPHLEAPPLHVPLAPPSLRRPSPGPHPCAHFPTSQTRPPTGRSRRRFSHSQSPQCRQSLRPSPRLRSARGSSAHRPASPSCISD
jgi:hypothetical protein